MEEAPRSQAADDAHRPALVAETAQLALVRKTLAGLLVNATSEDPGEQALGLTRLPLRDSNGDDLIELDGLLAEVRRRIARDHGGWVPPLGKDREANTALAMMRGGNPKPTGLAPQLPTEDDLQLLPAAAGRAALGASAGAVRVGLVDTEEADWNAQVDDVEAWRGHASFVRGIVESAAEGVAVELEPALDGPGGTGTAWKVANAIARLAAGGVDILLLPLACFTADGQPPLLIQRAVEAVPASTLIIAAAGNQTLDPGWSALGRGPTNPAWPAALPRVKAIGVNPGEIKDFDATGLPPVQPWVDAVTGRLSFVGEFFHGVVLLGGGAAESFSGLARWTGTSFSAAYAAGLVAARMLSEPGLAAVDAWDALLDEGVSLQRPPVAEPS